MTTLQHSRRAELATFLGLTFGLSAVFWWLIIDAGSLGVGGGRVSPPRYRWARKHQR